MSIKIYRGLRALDTNPFLVAHEAGLVMAEIFTNFFAASVDAANVAAANGASWEDTFEVPGSFDWCEDRVARESGRSMHRTVWNAVNTLARGDTYTKAYGCTLSYGYTLSLFPNGAGGNPLALVHTEEEIYHEALMAEGVFEDYAYWDNSDREYGISEEEWDRRRTAWEPAINRVTGAGKIEVPMPGPMDAELMVGMKRRKERAEAEATNPKS